MKAIKIFLIFSILWLSSCELDNTIKMCATVDLASVPDSILVSDVDTNKLELGLIKNRFWTIDTITVGFLDGDADIQAKTMAAAKAWEPYCRIRFVQTDVTKSKVRVTFAPGGSWSYIGTDCSYIRYPNATMQLGWLLNYRNNLTEISRVVTHEFGHTLGAIHEHQSPAVNLPWNTTAVYAYYAAQGWNKDMVDHNVLTPYPAATISNSVFDRFSIMLYAIPAQLLTNPSQAVGWNTSLSPTDKSFIGIIYPIRDVIVVPKKIDSCIVKTKLIEKDSVTKKQIITYVDGSIHIKRDSAYCKDTTFYR